MNDNNNKFIIIFFLLKINTCYNNYLFTYTHIYIYGKSTSPTQSTSRLPFWF